MKTNPLIAIAMICFLLGGFLVGLGMDHEHRCDQDRTIIALQTQVEAYQDTVKQLREIIETDSITIVFDGLELREYPEIAVFSVHADYQREIQKPRR